MRLLATNQTVLLVVHVLFVSCAYALTCVQCDSDTDKDCVSSTTGSECRGGERYCSSLQTTTYDGTGTTVRTVMTRGCATSFQAVDECAFTDIYSDYQIQSSGHNEFRCYSTCDTDNCNTNMPDGIVNGNEKVVLHCVVCSGIGSCASSTSRVPCPSDSTYCKSTVSYYVSEKTDLSYTEIPAYKLVSVVRECASAPVTKQCTESKFGILSFKKVTCQETCQEDGCNTGWPARPTCIQCSSHSLGDGYDECLSNPGLLSACHYPYQRYCYKTESGMNDGITESRGCAHFDMGNGCSSPWSTGIQSCNYTCTTDGCNGSGRLVLGNGALIVAIISSWLAKKMACTGRVA